MDQAALVQAENMVRLAEQNVFFHKLASHGITPTTDDEKIALLKLAEQIGERVPVGSPQSAHVKSASAEAFGQEVKLASDGFSEETHAYANQLMQNPALVAAAQAVLVSKTI